MLNSVIKHIDDKEVPTRRPKEAILISAVAGALAGAALAVMLVPERTIKKRNRMLRQGGVYMDDIEERFEDFLEKLTEAYDKLRKQAANAIDVSK